MKPLHIAFLVVWTALFGGAVGFQLGFMEAETQMVLMELK